MAKLATLANPTPGTFEPTQVPTTPVNLDGIPEDLVAPVIEHAPVTASEAYTDITIEANVTDDASVPYATLYYKKEGAENFTSTIHERFSRKSCQVYCKHSKYRS